MKWSTSLQIQLYWTVSVRTLLFLFYSHPPYIVYDSTWWLLETHFRLLFHLPFLSSRGGHPCWLLFLNTDPSSKNLQSPIFSFQTWFTSMLYHYIVRFFISFYFNLCSILISSCIFYIISFFILDSTILELEAITYPSLIYLLYLKLHSIINILAITYLTFIITSFINRTNNLHIITNTNYFSGYGHTPSKAP